MGEIWEALEALGSFFDVIFDQVTTHLKLRISSIEKKRSQERIWRGLGTILDSFWERFGASWCTLGCFLGVCMMLVLKMLVQRLLEGVWGRQATKTNMPRCISGWKSVSLKLLFYGTDS